jgi:NAD(P)-dependent dehydrogenase (short-subunit alcohol dehydrogenase family)
MAIATIPVGALGGVFHHQAESSWRSPYVIGGMLIGVGLLMALADRVGTLRKSISGTATRPRLSVMISNKHIYVQLVDDEASKTLAAVEPYQILINNAGGNRPAYLPDVKVEDFDFIFSLNVRAAFFMAQTVALRLLEAKLPGSIINISSQMGHVGAARRTVYCASKHAMEGFTKAMAIELAPHNIRVNSLGPTFLETPMTRPFFENKAFRDEVLAKIKLGRLGQLEELTGAIVFLASDASSLMTGQALVLDGGWTAE